MKSNEIHTWDRGYDDDGNQVSFPQLFLSCLNSLMDCFTAIIPCKYSQKWRKTYACCFLFDCRFGDQKKALMSSSLHQPLVLVMCFLL